MKLALAIFWLGVAALCFGLPKILLWLVIAFVIVLFFANPLAFLLGIAISGWGGKGDGCDHP